MSLEPCVVCGEQSEGMYGPEEGKHPSSMPVCLDCFNSGKLEAWWNAAKAEIDELGAKYGMMPWEPDKSLAWHLKEYRAHAKSRIRQEDGVCPNGCARLEMKDGDPHLAFCPRCGFHGYSNVPHPFFDSI